MIRTFLAFDIPESHRIECFRLIQRGLKFYPQGIKWVEQQNLHITLLFLGEIEDNDTHIVVDLLEKYADIFPQLHLTNARVNWNSISKPQTLWVEYDITNQNELNRILKQYKKELRSKLPYLDFDNKDFLCHLTLGRIKQKINIEKWQVYNEIVNSNFALNEISLYESILYSTGPVYKCLAKFDYSK
jgi:2'-5' RNA ligase